MSAQPWLGLSRRDVLLLRDLIQFAKVARASSARSPSPSPSPTAARLVSPQATGDLAPELVAAQVLMTDIAKKINEEKGR